TVVSSMLGTHVAKWAASSTPETATSRRVRASAAVSARRWATSTTTARIGSVSRLRQAATASAGAAASRIKGPEVETATTPTASRARSARWSCTVGTVRPAHATTGGMPLVTTVDPDIQTLLDALAAMGEVDLADLGPAQARDLFKAMSVAATGPEVA